MPDKWEQLKKQYEILHPFGDEREFISIRPADFVIMTQKYQKLVHNSFLLHGYFNYRHLILGRDTGSFGNGDICFCLGVPGVFYEREKMVAIMFGFEGFETEGKVEDGKFELPAQVVYNALDEKEIERKTLLFEGNPKSEEITRLISIGRLEKVKGFERLIEAFAELIKETPNVELYLVGDGSERSELEKLIAEKKVGDKVKLLGFKSNPYPYLKSSDVFVCSSYAEGFSTVVTEALILGIPTVTTECAGMRELLGDSEYGLIVENSTKGILDGLRKMTGDPVMLEAYQKKAKERGRAFCVADRIKEIEVLIEQDCEKKRRR